MTNASLLLLLAAALGAADLTPVPPDDFPDAVVVELPGGAGALGVRESIASLGPEGWVWTGHMLGEAESSLVLTRVEGVVRGVLRSYRGELQVTAGVTGPFRASALAARAEDDRAPLAPAVPPLFEPRGTGGGRSGPIDLLVVYTPSARAAAGSAREMDALVHLGVAEANLALERSGVAARVRLVELRELDYLESGRLESDLEILRNPADGALDEVQRIRDAFGADLVQLVVAEDDGCGLAYLLQGTTFALHSWAFSVVEWSCIDGALALAHEIGHALGCDHAPDDPTTGGAFDFSFGYRDPVNRFRTVMAYGPAPRVARFSSSRNLLAGLPTGSPGQDNARTIDRVWASVARFRPSLEPARLALASGATLSAGSAELHVLPSAHGDVEYWVIAGTSPGERDLFDSGSLPSLGRIRLSGLPGAGSPVFVRLFYRPGRVWLHEDFHYVATP